MGSSEVSLKASPTCASNHHVPCDLCGLKDCEVDKIQIILLPRFMLGLDLYTRTVNPMNPVIEQATQFQHKPKFNQHLGQISKKCKPKAPLPRYAVL